MFFLRQTRAYVVFTELGNVMYKSPEKMTCLTCSTEIIEYFEKRYHGMRGKCTICEIDFPLE